MILLRFQGMVYWPLLLFCYGNKQYSPCIFCNLHSKSLPRRELQNTRFTKILEILVRQEILVRYFLALYSYLNKIMGHL